MNHLEIEYKTLLTKDEYNRLAMLFSHVTPVTQTNYYIDTPQSDMRNKKLSLRIRTLPSHGELTLKIPEKVGNMEYNVTMDWEQFLDPYIQAVGELKIKLRGIRKQFRKKNRHSPIEFVTGRVKSVASIEEKIALRGLSVENLAQDMQDIAGLRVMVQFVDDVDEVLALLRHRSDMTIVSERDYIRNRKHSGYRSYHVIVSYPVDTIDGRKEILAEIQIRTLAMNFWATIEHSLNYKYQGNFPEEIKLRLENTARMAYELDEEMRKIRDDIREAQLLFDPINRTLKDSVGNSDDTDEDLFG